MRSIVTVNTVLPSLDQQIEYESGETLLDYDVVIFDPQLPTEDRINFSGGGSCISIEGGKALRRAMNHWSRELKDALKAGKTVFFLLNNYETDSVADSYRMEKSTRNYSTSSINNYDVLPLKVSARNAKGHLLNPVDGRFKGLHSVIKDVAGYKVIIDEAIGQPTFATKNNEGILGTLVTSVEMPGNLILLPYFSLAQMYEYDDRTGEPVWSNRGLKLSNAVVGQLLAIDKSLQSQNLSTPAPDWLAKVDRPALVRLAENRIDSINKQIVELEASRSKEIEEKDKLLRYSALLYENSKALETAIEDTLNLIGYKVENYRKNDVEIDHVIIGPSGLRMIGESEGKDNSAIGVSKFRQLESNIGEDFEREEITTPAKGIIFGNGFRLIEPDKRPEQFTEKCLTNAKRLHTALVRTSDLYQVAVYALNHPDDEAFKAKCRKALESAEGEIVHFPAPPPPKPKTPKLDTPKRPKLPV